MAIKITTDSIVKMIRPSNKKFNVDDLSGHVKGFIEPVKLGPIWLMFDEDAKSKGAPLNEIASFFFDVAIHGTALIVPPQQLPSEWDLMDPSDYRYTANDVDNGFLMTLQNALMHKRVFGDSLGTYEHRYDMLTPQEEWTYKPNEGDEDDKYAVEFFDKVYDHIKENPLDIQNNILINDEDVIVKVDNDDDMKLTLNQMIEHYISMEEYEKCSFLRDVL